MVFISEHIVIPIPSVLPLWAIHGMMTGAEGALTAPLEWGPEGVY
jgi:hypothetical protein